MSLVRQYFSNLLGHNQELMKDLKVRAGQGDNLNTELKSVKRMINIAGNLRSSSFK